METYLRKGTKSKATMLATLIIGLIAGPTVSLRHDAKRRSQGYWGYYLRNGTNNKATILATLIIGLIAGPAVSLYGSPTVSPVTAA